MRCSKCGEPAKIRRRFNMDGITKELAYCAKCFREMLKHESSKYLRSGLYTITNHMELVEEGKVVERNFRMGIDEVYSEQPFIIQLTLFGADGETYERTVEEIKERRIFILNHKLKKAIRLEKYRKASMIKKQIEDLRRSVKNE